ncbi:MAG TPA: DUF6547 family protein [Gemmatimonadales bacterium]|nr:DUF6547 family protein [Gemmatimonadales bacterium]
MHRTEQVAVAGLVGRKWPYLPKCVQDAGAVPAVESLPLSEGHASDWQDGTVTEDWLQYREQQYREVIDRLMHACREGQGQISSLRVRRGVWNSNADQKPADMPDQAEMNALLSRLPSADRELLAGFFAEEFVSGVHEALVVLHEAQIAPFDDGYEGTPFHDFVGRLDAWPWPDA